MKLYLHTAWKGLALAAGLGILWLLIGGRALFFVMCAVLLYSIALPLLMVRVIQTAHATVSVRYPVIMMGKPNMVTAVLTGASYGRLLQCDFSLQLPPYLLRRHERRTARNLTVFFEAGRRGEYEVGDVTLTVLDPISVFHLFRTIHDPQQVTVFPRLLPLQKLRIALTSPLDGQRVRFAPNDDTSQLIGTHPYAGEPFNRIHWKMSAHAGHLFTKEFSPSASKTLVILLNLTLRRTPIFDTDVFEDYLCAIAGSIARYACDRQLPFGLIALGQRQEASDYGGGPTHLAACLSILAHAHMKVEPDPTKAVFLEYLQTKRYALPAQSQLFLIQQEMTEEEVETLLRMRARFSRVSIALFPQGSFRFYNESKAPYFMKDYDQIERLRSTQKILRTAGIDLSIIGLNDTISALSEA